MTTTAPHIIAAGPAQLNELVQISADTFSETFAVHNSAADMADYLALHMSHGPLAKELSDSRNWFYLATVGPHTAGYCKLRKSEAPAELAHDQAIELERLYVSARYHSQKIGAALMRHAIDMAVASQASVLWLGVWEHNHKAIGFYQKWGFTTFGSHGFQLGNDLQTDLLMSLRLPA